MDRRITEHPAGLVGHLVSDDFDWEGDTSPATPLRDSVIYECHVRGLTMRHPDVPPALRGTYRALAHPAVVEHLRAALGDLFDHVELEDIQLADSTSSGFGDANPLWSMVAKHTQIAYPGAELLPGIVVGGTDARFFRQRGSTAYGTGIFSPGMDFATFGSRFHGHNERIDVPSLGLSGNFWYGIAKDLVG